jgi:hypothetical protein
MKLEELLKNVAPEWHKEFLRFVETGEAEDNFLQYLNKDKGGQAAVEMAFDAQVKAFEGLAEELKKPQPQIEAPAELARAASRTMATAVETIVQLPPEQRGEALENAASVLGTSLPPEQQDAARSVARSLEHALAKVAG